MAGRTPQEAVVNYVGHMQKAVSCVTDAVFTVTGYRPSERPLLLLLNNSDPVRLSGQSRMFLEAIS